MPPKSKVKGKKGEPKADEAVPESSEKSILTPKEVLLKGQLDNITEELKKLKVQVEELRHENEFLQQEAQQTKVETHEFMSYMSKKTQKRHNNVISLSDYHAEQIREIQSKKHDLLSKFAEEKERLNATILSRQAELASLQKELAELSDFKVLQSEQQAEIAGLEKQVAEMRVKHNEAVQQLKARFLQEKKRFQADSDNHLMNLRRAAKKEAKSCLKQHSQQIRIENRALRKELLELIQKTRSLHNHKIELQEQHKVLLREREYAEKFQVLRGIRNRKVNEDFGLKQGPPSDS